MFVLLSFIVGIILFTYFYLYTYINMVVKDVLYCRLGFILDLQFHVKYTVRKLNNQHNKIKTKTKKQHNVGTVLKQNRKLVKMETDIYVTIHCHGHYMHFKKNFYGTMRFEQKSCIFGILKNIIVFSLLKSCECDSYDNSVVPKACFFSNLA